MVFSPLLPLEAEELLAEGLPQGGHDDRVVLEFIEGLEEELWEDFDAVVADLVRVFFIHILVRGVAGFDMVLEAVEAGFEQDS